MTELTLQEALAEVSKFGKIIKGLEKLTEVSQALSGAEQLVAERQAQADALLPVIEERTAAAAMAATAAEEALAARDTTLANAKAKADKIVADADAKARQMIEAGTEELADLHAQADVAKTALQMLNEQQAEAETALANVRSLIDAANEARRRIIAGEA